MSKSTRHWGNLRRLGKNPMAAALELARYRQKLVETKTRYRRKLKHKGRQASLFEGRP